MKVLKYKRGFTLIELLVVIGIIGTLSTIVLASLNSARAKARNARRLVDVGQIQIALDIYYSDNGRYPDPNSSNGSWEVSDEDGGDFIDFLKDYGYMPVVPVDPINSGLNTYYYYRYGAGYANCPVSNGAYYVLGIKDMENINLPHPSSPGWNCPLRNWQPEFDWVVGKFEN